MSSQTCYDCIYFGQRKQDPVIQTDWWCYRFDMRVLNDTPKCEKFEKREGPEGSVNAPYLGYMKREEDRKLEEKKRQEDADRKHGDIGRTQRIIAVAMLLTVAMGFWGVQIQKGTQEIVNETQRIVAESSIPNEPQLTVSLKSDPIIFQEYLTDVKRYHGDRGWTLEVCLSNDGRKSTGRILLNWHSEWTDPLGEPLDSIDGGNTSCILLGVNCRECLRQYKDRGVVNESLMPTEPNLKLELKVDCKYCDPRVFIETFNICVYEKNREECDAYSTRLSRG